jgi:hypothetical protein
MILGKPRADTLSLSAIVAALDLAEKDWRL